MYYSKDTPVWLVVLVIPACLAAGIAFAELSDRFSGYLNPNMIRIGLGGAGCLLLIILIAVGIRKFFRD